MTYPQYQQPQGYGPGAPYAQPAQQYPPQPAQPQAQPYVPQPQVATGIVDATQPGGGLSPFVRELVGRVVFVRPLLIERVPPKNPQYPGELKDRITAEVIVCDGGTLMFGAKVQPPTPPTHRTEVPARFSSMWINGTNMVKALTPLVGTGQAMLGEIKVGIGTKGNPPLNIVPLAQNDPRREMAINIMAQVTSGQIAWPEPVSLMPAAPQGYAPQYAPNGGYAMTPQAYAAATGHVPGYAPPPGPQMYAQAGGQAYPMQPNGQGGYTAGPIPAAPVQAQQYAPAPQQTAQPYYPPAGQVMGMTQQGASVVPAGVPQPQSAPPAAAAPVQAQQMPAQGTGPGGMYMPEDVPPQGWPAEVWAQMTQQQKDQIRGGAAAQPAANATGF